jgi:hypothetical protein
MSFSGVFKASAVDCHSHLGSIWNFGEFVMLSPQLTIIIAEIF